MGERQSQLKSGAGSLLKKPPNKDSKTLDWFSIGAIKNQLCGVEIWSRAPDLHLLLIGVIH